MLCIVRHLWPSGAHFISNCYCLQSSIVLRNGDETANTFHSKEGATQGYPLTIVVYGIGFIPLTKRLKLTYPEVIQRWYADDAGALGTFDNLEQYFNLVKRNGPDQVITLIALKPY